ncbi:MAG: hypothetical protein NTW43_03620 [Actinobacteria bacterium]|nr:hypothetical protein [Actinomycetota bacterium]
MSFWKKLFGKSEQPVAEVNIAEDELQESQLDADFVGEPGNELEEVAVASEIESSTADEVEPDVTVDQSDESADLEIESVKEKIEASEESEADADVTTEDQEATDSVDQEAKAKSDAEAAEELLRQELEDAETAALNAQLEIEKEEFLEDLSVLDGRILPQLKVPDWHEELEFVKERYEPCDLSDHIVKVSKRRLTARQIDHELAESRRSAYRRYFERASRRFKDKIDEDALLNEALADLTAWKSEQGKSIAWKLVDRVNEEVVKAKKAEEEATSFVENNIEFVNPAAVKVYREFARRAWLIPIVTLYITSVVGLTYNRFEWILKFLPFFNLGLSKTLIMISGIAAGFWISNLWKYSKHVARIQKKLVLFKAKHEEQHDKIKHSVKQHTRLAQQQPLVEPILRVLAKAYRVQLQSDVSARAQVTTNFDPAVLPACVTLARAVDTDELKMNRLRRRALNVLMSPGWRTNGLNQIAGIHADSQMLDSSSLSLKSLDTDSLVSASNAQKLLNDAFSNPSIHHRVSKARLVKAIKELHKEVLANWNSDERPQVSSMRDDGFDKIAFQSSWLVEEDASEDWIEFLTEILGDETAPFGHFNIFDRSSELNNADLISSVAVVPHYFAERESKVKIEKSKSQDVMPMDVVVRVDVSPWSDPSAFAIFSDGGLTPSVIEEEGQTVERTMTSD